MYIQNHQEPYHSPILPPSHPIPLSLCPSLTLFLSHPVPLSHPSPLSLFRPLSIFHPLSLSFLFHSHPPVIYPPSLSHPIPLSNPIPFLPYPSRTIPLSHPIFHQPMLILNLSFPPPTYVPLAHFFYVPHFECGYCALKLHTFTFGEELGYTPEQTSSPIDLY